MKAESPKYAVINAPKLRPVNTVAARVMPYWNCSVDVTGANSTTYSFSKYSV
jgi:hypothetical protein